jgi:hypothetical protein
MAGSGGQADRVDQIRFELGEPDRLGTWGYGPVASSLPNTGDLETWTGRLHLYYRSDDSPLQRRPPVSQVYWSDGEHAAVLRRIRGRDDNRHDTCHAAVGLASALTVRDALCMEDAWWRELRAQDQQARRPVDLRALWTDRHAVEDRLDRRGRQLHGYLNVLAAAALPDPRRPISVIAGDMDNADKMALLWAFLDLTEVPGESRPWTFSTYETRHDDVGRDLPHVVLLAEAPPRSAFEVSRRMANLVGPARHGEFDAPARAWVAEYLRAGGPAARTWWDNYRPTTAPIRPLEPEAAGPYLPSPSGVPAPRPSSSPPPSAPPSAPPTVPPPPEPPRQEPPRQEPARQEPARRGPDGPLAPPEPRPPPHPAGPPAQQPPAAVKLVNGIGRARQPEQARQVLAEIEGGLVVAGAADREKIRHRLFAKKFWEQELGALFDVDSDPYATDEVRDAVRTLIRFAFGPDLAVADAAARAIAFIAQPDTPMVVARELYLYAAEQGLPHVLDQGYATRWKRHEGLPARPVHASGPGDGVSERNWWRLATFALAGCLVVAATLLFTSRGAPGAAPPNGPTARSTAAPTTRSGYPGYRPAFGPQTIDMPAPTCTEPSYLDVDKPTVGGRPADAEFAYSAACSQDRQISVNLTSLPGISVSDVTAQGAGSHQCLSSLAWPVSVDGPPHPGQQLCIDTNADRVVEMKVVSIDPGGSMRVQLAGWERQH